MSLLKDKVEQDTAANEMLLGRIVLYIDMSTAAVSRHTVSLEGDTAGEKFIFIEEK